MKQILKMRLSVHSRQVNAGWIPACINCNLRIEVDDKYVKSRSFRSKPRKIYCVPCAEMLNII